MYVNYFRKLYFTYSHKGSGESKILMEDGEGVGLVVAKANQFFYKCQNLLVQNELIFNL